MHGVVEVVGGGGRHIHAYVHTNYVLGFIIMSKSVVHKFHNSLRHKQHTRTVIFNLHSGWELL